MSVTSPRSRVLAPAGTTATPTDLIRPLSTTTRPGVTMVPRATSTIRAARTTRSEAAAGSGERSCDRAALHDEGDPLQRADVAERIALHGHQVRQLARGDDAAVAHPEHLGGVERGTADGLDRRLPQLDPDGELARVLPVRVHAGVGAEGDPHARAHGELEAPVHQR